MKLDVYLSDYLANNPIFARMLKNKQTTNQGNGSHSQTQTFNESSSLRCFSHLTSIFLFFLVFFRKKIDLIKKLYHSVGTLSGPIGNWPYIYEKPT